MEAANGSGGGAVVTGAGGSVVVSLVVELVVVERARLVVVALRAVDPPPSSPHAASAIARLTRMSRARRSIEPVSHRLVPYRDRRMAGIEQQWVALTSATSARAGHGPHPCQGLYHRPAAARARV